MPKRMCGEENLIANIKSLFKVTNAMHCLCSPGSIELLWMYSH